MIWDCVLNCDFKSCIHFKPGSIRLFLIVDLVGLWTVIYLILILSTDNNLELSGDLAELSTEISIKEKLIDELETSQKKIQSLKTQYEEKLSLLHNKIKETETERDQVNDWTLKTNN